MHKDNYFKNIITKSQKQNKLQIQTKIHVSHCHLRVEWNNCRDCARQDSSVGMVTCFRLDSLGIEFQWQQNFLHLSRLAMGPIVPAIQCVLG